MDYVLIGIDGGASKINGWIISVNEKTGKFILSDSHYELSYAEFNKSFDNFKPVTIQKQLFDYNNQQLNIGVKEQKQGEICVYCCAQVIEKLCKKAGIETVILGIGMPGLKTEDKCGIAVIINGPRIPAYASMLSQRLKQNGIKMAFPITEIGSDAYYCGIGERYAESGSFQDVTNAYYLGGGTGAADALLLEDQLISFDEIKSWYAKTWEMQNEKLVPLEKYASSSGIQFIYAQNAGKSTKELIDVQMYPSKIANLALEGDVAAIQCFKEVVKYLALLFYERITTLFCGSQKFFTFINQERTPLKIEHHYREKVFDRLVVGQRLGDLMSTRSGKILLTQPLFKQLSLLIADSSCLTERAKKHYLHGNLLRDNRIVISSLREAPALGAGISALQKHMT